MCERLVQGRYSAMRRPGVEHSTCWLQVQRPNHYTTEPHELFWSSRTDSGCHYQCAVRADCGSKSNQIYLCDKYCLNVYHLPFTVAYLSRQLPMLDNALLSSIHGSFPGKPRLASCPLYFLNKGIWCDVLRTGCSSWRQPAETRYDSPFWIH